MTLQNPIANKIYNDVLDAVKDDVRFELEHPDPNNTSLTVSWQTLNEHAGSLGEISIERPEEFLREASNGLREYMRDMHEAGEYEMDEKLIDDYRFRLIDLPRARHRNVRDIWPTDINTLVSINCKIEKRTVVQPKIQRLAFRCNSCGTTEMAHVVIDSINPPTECGGCGSKSFTANYNHSDNVWIPSQLLRIKEKVENLDGTKQPESMKAKIKHDICGNVEGGDDLTLTGIVRADESGGTDEETVSGMYLEVIGIDKDDKDFDEVDVTDEEKEHIYNRIHNANDVFNLVKQSIAPSIHGYETEKGALGLILFGGVPKPAQGGGRIRGDIHMLLIGDPGVGKSQMLSYVDNVAPRSVQSSGQGSSAAGLTASAVQDDFGGGNQWSLEAGALVLADGGIAIIDEIDKMKNSDRSSIHEALEQQTVSVAKAGINSTLNTRCSLLAAANPVEGRWNKNEPLAQQIDLAPPLISRFDLIFTVEDKQNDEDDEKIANHVINNHRVGAEFSVDGDDIEMADYDVIGDENVIDRQEFDSVNPEIDPDTMRKYISLGRQITPKMTDEVKEFIKSQYVDIRSQNSEDQDEYNRSVPITARKLEAMIRLSEAVARMHLSETITLEHAEIALDVVRATMERVGRDPETGDFDSNMIDSTTSKSTQDKWGIVKQSLKTRIESQDDISGVGIEELKQDINSAGHEMSKDEVENMMEKFSSSGRPFYRKPDGKYMPTF